MGTHRENPNEGATYSTPDDGYSETLISTTTEFRPAAYETSQGYLFHRAEWHDG